MNKVPKLQRRPAEPLRNYIYISDTKLDMLFEQIPRGVLKRFSAEVRVDLKLASVTLAKSENTGLARMAKLRIVERYIDRHNHVGSISMPGREYFRGTMSMRWGPLGWTPDDHRDHMVFFKGEQGSITVMLAGSNYHLLGQPSGARAVAYSALPHIVRAVNYGLSEYESHEPISEDANNAVNDAAAVEIYPPEIPAQELEFLAIPLYEDEIDLLDPAKPSGHIRSHGILGSPLYVAQARTSLDLSDGVSAAG
jgi:hypothetical protein